MANKRRERTCLVKSSQSTRLGKGYDNLPHLKITNLRPALEIELYSKKYIQNVQKKVKNTKY